ncbi:MAG: ribosome biogenesis GTP-binding protein YihA/YsxC [Clostridia bacterium]
MLIKNPKFEISAVTTKQYPNNDLPQIVLVGKSNVGKSSFINTMVNRKKLARTSSEPGKTRQINFYNMDDNFYFVDLPGYGYSKMSKKRASNCR